MQPGQASWRQSSAQLHLRGSGLGLGCQGEKERPSVMCSVQWTDGSQVQEPQSPGVQKVHTYFCRRRLEVSLG